MDSVLGTQGSVSVVTGASGGIGQAVVKALEEAGRTVIGIDRRSGQRDVDLVCDVTDPTAVEQVVESIETEHGPIDQPVNGAGVLCTSPPSTPHPRSGGASSPPMPARCTR